MTQIKLTLHIQLHRVMSAAVWRSEKLSQMETVIQLYVSSPGDKILVTKFCKKKFSLQCSNARNSSLLRNDKLRS